MHNNKLGKNSRSEGVVHLPKLHVEKETTGVDIGLGVVFDVDRVELFRLTLTFFDDVRRHRSVVFSQRRLMRFDFDDVVHYTGVNSHRT